MGTLHFYLSLAYYPLMPRLTRIVPPEIPQYITQRGNRREDVFFFENDYYKYLYWLKEYSLKHKVEKRIIPQDEWSEWLKLPEVDKEIVNIRRNVEKGLPCGNDGFISKLERISGRTLTFRPQGRPVKG